MKRHLVLTDSNLHGAPYGIQRDLESELCRLLGATRVSYPESAVLQSAKRNFGHGMRFAPFRQLVPKINFELTGDVLWVPAMGPEDCALDLCANWSRGVGTTVLYLFDTFEAQLPAIRRVLSAGRWDFLVTSFPDAVDWLEFETGRKWYGIPQGVVLDRFRPPQPKDRTIGFSSYGRNEPQFHQTLLRFCEREGIYYDYSPWSSLSSQVPNEEIYRQYAWHVGRSNFTVAWPVEASHPQRAGSLSPITCRWFEAAASCTPLLGQLPWNPQFKHILGFDEHVRIDLNLSEAETEKVLKKAWRNRSKFLESARRRYPALSYSWSWEARIHDMVALLDSVEATAKKAG